MKLAVNQQSLVYTVVGLLAGGLITALIFNYGLRPSDPFASQTPAGEQSLEQDTDALTPANPGGRVQLDQRFILMMIPHHEQAIEMAQLAARRAQHPEMKQLASAIIQTQTREIQQMRSWYQQWYGTPVPAWTPGMGLRGWGQMPWGGGMHRSRFLMGPQAMGSNLAVLERTENFDREFIEQMIPHHQMAVMMAQMAVNSAAHPQARTLAASIIETQGAEINRMQQWYQQWYAR